jgi:shikimate kinase
MSPNKTYYLCGFMGSGKSTILKTLMLKHNILGYDLDSIIENRYGDIAEIFTNKGEKYFREVEEEVFFEFFKKPQLFSLGGGSIENVKILKALVDSGTSIYLKNDFETLWNFIEKSDRPLVKLGKVELQSLFLKREENYKKLNMILDANDLIQCEKKITTLMGI